MGKEMKNWLSTGKFNEKDEYYTPKILVEPILKFLKPNSYIWCSFDTEDSEFVILLIVDKKVSFDGNTASFNNSYFCKDVLPRDLMFAHLEHNNSNDNFVGSRMSNLDTTQETSLSANLLED